jgi:hypothetical protein
MNDRDKTSPSSPAAPRSTTRTNPEIPFESTDDDDATIMGFSTDIVLPAKKAAEKFKLGHSQIPELSTESVTNDKTVVGFSVGDAFRDLSDHGINTPVIAAPSVEDSERRFDEPVLDSSSGPSFEDEESEENEERTMFGVSMDMVEGAPGQVAAKTPARAPGPPPLPTPPPLKKKKRSKPMTIPVEATSPEVVAPTSADVVLLPVNSPPPTPRGRESSSGLRAIPLSEVAPERAAKKSKDEKKLSKPSASSIRGASVDRAALGPLDPIMPGSSLPSSGSLSMVDLDPVMPHSSTPQLNAHDARGRASAFYDAKSPRPMRPSNHGWAKSMILGIFPGSFAFSLGRNGDAARHGLVAAAVLFPALFIALSWSKEVARLDALSISNTWLLGHALICASALVAFEAVRVVAMPHRESIAFTAPRWIAILFLPCLFLLKVTPRLIEYAPGIVEPVWYVALIAGGFSCMASVWCVFYDVRAAGPKDIQFWAAAGLGLLLFATLLVVSGIINLRLL